jgi:hypothetical protein
MIPSKMQFVTFTIGSRTFCILPRRYSSSPRVREERYCPGVREEQLIGKIVGFIPTRNRYCPGVREERANGHDVGFR